MKAKTRRKLEMGAKALDFSRDYPDPSPGYSNAVARLQDCLTRGTRLAEQQINSILEVHATAERKRNLLRMMRRAHLAHLKRVARVARREAPELAGKFVLPRGTIPYRDFQSAARSMLAEAQTQRDVMVRHGLTETILQSLEQSLEEFDQAVERGIDAHRMQVGASAGLDEVGDEVVRIVGLMDPLNRYRFANAPGVLAEWASISHVVSMPRSPVAEAPAPVAADVRPAA